DGRPLRDAVVTFIPDGSGCVAHGYSGNDGVFRLGSFTTGDGAFSGDYKETITVQRRVPEKEGPPPGAPIDFVKMAKEEENQAQDPSFRKGWGEIPNKDPKGPKSLYGDLARTPLKCRVPVDRPLVFDLQSEGGK